MKKIVRYILFLTTIFSSLSLSAQNSVAHEWIDINLEAVRKDFARPTVHARNLWHISVVMYDAWAAYDSLATPFFLGKGLGDYDCPFDGVPVPADLKAAREEAISFAAFRVIRHRYNGSPGQVNTYFILDTMMTHLGYDPGFTSTDYSTGVPAALGNYIAQEFIAAALQDGANESNGYANQYYEPVNEDLVIDQAHFIGNPDIDSLNRWQPLGLTLFCDQGGNSFTTTPAFLSPEWGNVIPFSLADSVKSVKTRDGNDWIVYHDPGPPPLIALEGDLQTEDYRWGFDLVAKWSSHLDPDDTTMWDISPASLGNIPFESLPEDVSDYPNFYDRDNGGDASQGYDVNPHTGLPYAPQIVKRGDYARILAEFWADGPDSETPPGHWFDIYNEISEYPEFTWKWNAQDSLDHLEYDIKTYFTLGGGMHDVAISAWGIKGYYDYIRPVSAIRAMAELGQSTSNALPNYHPAGLELEDGFMELVQLGDTLWESDTVIVAGPEYVGELKMMCWLGPLTEDTCITGFAPDYQTDVAGVGWKLALDWWPYQRPTFVTPPFAGYISGHSTFSRAAAEIMTYTTGDRYFPGGMGIFDCPENEFLVFEEGPSEFLELQWATYQDASDQCSLSRIWGGIHPPADDIPGRKIGYEIGHSASALAQFYFNGGSPAVESVTISDDVITDADDGSTLTISIEFDQRMDVSTTPSISFGEDVSSTLTAGIGAWPNDTVFQMSYTIVDMGQVTPLVSMSLSAAKNFYGNDQQSFDMDDLLLIEMENPTAVLSFDESASDHVTIELSFDETMDTATDPVISFPVEDPLSGIISFNSIQSGWLNNTTYSAWYDVSSDVQMHDIDIAANVATDSYGNEMVSISEVDYFSIDNLAPSAIDYQPNVLVISDSDMGIGTFSVDITFDEDMDTDVEPMISFPVEDPLSSLALSVASSWTDALTYQVVFDVMDVGVELADIDLEITQAQDLLGNVQATSTSMDLFSIDTRNPIYMSISNSSGLVTDILTGSSSVTVDIDFDEAMDTGQIPTITFPDEQPGASLTLSGGSWLDSDTYQGTFDVTDEDLVLAGVDLLISGAADLVGNLVSDTLLQDLLDIEMDNPAVASFAADQTLITDVNISEFLNLRFGFSEDLDISGTPSIDFPEGDLSNTLTFVDQVWIGSDSLEVTYSIQDDNLDLSDIDVQIGMVSDLVGNSSEMAVFTDVFSVEMLNPSVNSIIYNTTLVDNALIGPGNFTIDAEFSEVLDQAFEPALSFPVEDPSSTLTLNSLASTWTSESSYRFAYDVAAGMTSLPDVDIQIVGAVDLVGNMSFVELEEDAFDIDIASSLSENGSVDLHIFPNPIHIGDPLIIRLGENSGKHQFTLLDGIGRQVQALETSVNHSDLIQLGTEDLSAGSYLLHVTNDLGTSTFMIQVVR